MFNKQNSLPSLHRPYLLFRPVSVAPSRCVWWWTSVGQSEKRELELRQAAFLRYSSLPAPALLRRWWFTLLSGPAPVWITCSCMYVCDLLAMRLNIACRWKLINLLWPFICEFRLMLCDLTSVLFVCVKGGFNKRSPKERVQLRPFLFGRLISRLKLTGYNLLTISPAEANERWPS